MDVSALKAFLRWGSKFPGFPYSTLLYYIEAYERGDGLDCFGRKL